MLKATVTAQGSIELPADLWERHGLSPGSEVLVEDAGNAIILHTLDQVVAAAQAVSRRLTAGHPHASVADFLAQRGRDSGD